MIYVGYQSACQYLDNILDFSQLSANKVTLDLKKANFTEIVYEALDKFKELHLESFNVEFSVEVKADKCKVVCDVEKIQQVIINLIDNAVKYGGEGAIKIAIENTDLQARGFASLSISDNGVGIPDSELAYIFGPFIQSTYTKKPSGGRGLGLAICEKLVILHGGRIWAENNVERNGATFYFIIPLS